MSFLPMAMGSNLGRWALLALLIAGSTTPASAQVRIVTREDGSRFIYNETPVQHERRFANRLLPVPVADWIPVIEHHASSQGLPSRLVRAVIQAESGYNARAVSNKGCIGLMQLKPSTARELAVKDPYDPEQNVRGGTTYLRQLLDRFENRVELAVAAYNAGPGAVERHGGIPPYAETRDYVQRVMRLYSGADFLAGSSTRMGRMPHIVRRDGKVYMTTDP